MFDVLVRKVSASRTLRQANALSKCLVVSLAVGGVESLDWKAASLRWSVSYSSTIDDTTHSIQIGIVSHDYLVHNVFMYLCIVVKDKTLC